MQEPVEYLILRDLQAALARIAQRDGYHFDVRELAVKLDPNQDVESLIAPDGPRPFVLIEAFTERTPERWNYRAAYEVELTIPVTIHWVSESVPTKDEGRLQVFLRGCADVERAITQDTSRGGRAIDTRIVKRTFDTAVDGSQVWAPIDVDIRFLRSYGQP